jgi:NHLM bacteriocin system ABC transporter ATP-binding protein
MADLQQLTPSKPCALASNELLVLDSPEQIWQVQSGLVGIFSVAWRDGKPTGMRRYLFSLAATEIMFGAVPKTYGLMAIALEPTVLVPSVWACPKSQNRICNDIQLQQLSAWFNAFSKIEGFPQPESSLPFSAQYLSLKNGDSYCADERLIWIQIKSGKALWLGRLDSPLTSNSQIFPLGKGAWLQAQDSTEIQVCEPGEILAISPVVQGITQFHSHCLTLIEAIIAAQDRSESQQFQQRQQLDQQTTQHTLQNLAGLLQSQDKPFLSAKTPLLVAAGAVCHALGVEISAPSSAENLEQVKEPLAAIARASQLRLRQVLLRGQWWHQDSGPMVVYRRDSQQPMALLPTQNSRYELLDSITLQRFLVDQSVADGLEPRAMVFYRPIPAGQISVWSLLQFAFYGRQRDLWTILITGGITSLLGMAIPQATAVLIDEAIPYGEVVILFQIALALLAVAVGQSCFQFARAIAAMRIESASDATLQSAVWDRLLKLHPAFFRAYTTGDLHSRVSSIAAIRRQLSGTALDAMLSGAFALLNLGLLFYYSAKLAGLALLVALLVVSVTAISGAILLKKQRPLLTLEGDLYGLMVQLINGISKLRLAGAEPRAFAQWGEKYGQQIGLEVATQRLEDVVSVFNTIMPTLMTIVLFAWASTGLDPTGGVELSTGKFLAFSTAFGIFISGATSLSLTLIEVLEIIPLWQRAQPILTAQLEVDSQKGDPGKLTGRICLDHVTFRYREDGPLILEDVTVEAYPGEFVALVGPSGSGKSTVLRLLLGFETPQSGTVYYDSQDVAGLDITAIRRQLGVVLQNGRINAGSLFENISGGALITLEEAWRAAEMAGFAEDVRSFPMQMHTVISEGGGNLSGGQRQRLVIARALALNPKILLLDEATSALDNRTQAIVSESLDRLKVTRIVIAHRLSTIRNADRIYVIKAGRVVQQGSFDELAARSGVFAELIKRQMA